MIYLVPCEGKEEKNKQINIYKMENKYRLMDNKQSVK